jgi:hypothetical protein
MAPESMEFKYESWKGEAGLWRERERERDKEACELLFKRGRGETRRQVNFCSREEGMLHFGWYKSISSGAQYVILHSKKFLVAGKWCSNPVLLQKRV